MNDKPPMRHRLAPPKTIAGADRSTLDLLGLAWPFSQVSLLTAEELVREAQNRRINMSGDWKLDVSGLQELHRLGVLVPFYRVDIDGGDSVRAIAVADSLTPRHSRSTVLSELYLGAGEGRVTDPAKTAFEPWPTGHRRTLWPSTDSGYLYSRHQLLTLDQARSAVAAFVRNDATSTVAWRLSDAMEITDEALQALRSWRSLAFTLTAIETPYWPLITRRISHDADVWRSVRLAFDAANALAWLGLTVEEVEAGRDQLLGLARYRDVVGDFYDLVRRADRASWDTLRGDAQVAMDYRLAAEVFERLATDVHGVERSQPDASVPLSAQSLGARSRSLDATLTDLHLSPHPSLVIGVEGATEMRLVPRVMELLGIEPDPGWIRIVDFGGTTQDLSLLARYAAQPHLGADHGDHVVLDRPLTRFLVLTDAENRYATRSDRAYQRKLLLDSVTNELPKDLRRDLYHPRSRFVEIVTWGRLPFEFAHFSDSRLADALLRAAGAPHPGGRSALIQAINIQRTRDPTPNINDAWRKSGVSKVQLADAVWPLLQKRIEGAIRRGEKGPPIMSAILRAYQLATLSYRRTIALSRPLPRQARR
ncbi:hypothetical protein ACFO1B_55475 [Dactylosporangium siamense]|uniref:Uncharacterized protein n=1 Tax=Dactylosporangium siamense TaxID=685454 RepID=A0A919Q0P3_9ACTN|nr:hypothetical protein [Dactylosporangium siamense]GIG53132.1 hypothetical protein Dsi01nite_111730 [Dactylosporangium siamense]